MLRKLLSIRNIFNRQKSETGGIVEEKWIADFSKQKHARFNIKSESSYDANLRKNQFSAGYSLALGLKKTGCIAWVEVPELRYRDLVISGSLRIDAKGGYGAGGIMFRMTDSETYYSLLISNKEYFRLDVIRNGMPFPLIGWTELPLSTGSFLNPDQNVDFSLISYANHIIILIRGRWAAELNDSSILEGGICFCAASYESGDISYRIIPKGGKGEFEIYDTEVFLESLTLESRFDEVTAEYEKWHESPDIDSKTLLNLAETFAAMNQYNTALVQLRKCWEIPGHRKTQTELLLAGRLAWTLELLPEAESYISECFEANVESPEGLEALLEMAKILDRGQRFKELKNYCVEALKIKPDDPILWNFQGHACWNLKEYKMAAGAYEKAFELDRKNGNKANGIYAKNAANVYDVMGQKKKTLARYLDAGRAFLEAGNYNDLGLIIPRLLSLGENNWEARSLAGKWAFAVEDWKMAKKEFAQAEKLRKAMRSRTPQNGAQVFLEALLFIREGKRRDALPLLKKAVSLEKKYALFHFRLAENLFLLDENPKDPVMLKALETALALSMNDEGAPAGDSESQGLAGWINNFAAQIALENGDLEAAEKYLDKARAVLGSLPAVKVNQGYLYYLQGSIDKALELLEEDINDDPEGLLANWAGVFLFRSGRFEEADTKYRQALRVNPDNIEYLSNHASCLIEQGLYGEADDLLTRAHGIAPSPVLLDMISYVAVKKGEYLRAEQACRSALKMDSRHAASLLSLGWILLGQSRYDETRDVIRRLKKLDLKEDTIKGRDELMARLEDMLYRIIDCASCERKWKVLKDPPPAPAIRLYAMPPDELPAGSCPGCGKTFCIGCAKSNLDSSGRFICPSCNRSLKLINEGLKMIVHKWKAKK